MATGEPNSRLRVAREACPSPSAPGEPMSRAELAEAVNDHLWRTTGKRYALDAHAIARYERGKVGWPSAAYRAGLKAVLGADSDIDLGFHTTRRGRGGSAVHSEVDGTKEDALAWIVSELQRLELDYDVTPSSTLLSEAGQLHGAVKDAVRRVDAVGAQPWVNIQARSALLMGQLVWDASRRREGSAALAFFDEAVHCAQRCRDRRTVAQAQLRKCFIPLYATNNPKEALVSAQRAAHAAAQIPTARALALLHVSEAYGQLGQPQEAEHHLHAADQLAEKADLDQEEWLGRSRRIAGSVFLSLQSPRRAQALLEEARPLLRDRHKSQAIAVANMALAHVRQAKPDDAAAELHQAMHLVESTQAGGALTVVTAVQRELAPWRDRPAVVEAGERFLDLIAR